LNQAGGASEWSAPSAAASTGLPDEPITKVTNYPNPVDIRQGPTNVSYILNEDSTVKIIIFDLLGYQIRTWDFGAGSNGGKAGPNVFQWDGLDSGGAKVSAVGYIMRIEVVGAKGSTTVIRKIGIIN
jgi:flagellar hook assembly protein FlgD